jgi:hypothetical protein
MDCNVSGFTSGSVSLILDAPRSAIPSTGQLPTNFRSMYNLGVTGNRASGSAQYSAAELRHAMTTGQILLPLVMLDLRQEPHGFLHVVPQVLGEDFVAISWYAERDWLNVAKGRASILADERARLEAAAATPNLALLQVCTKTKEAGIETAAQLTAQPAGDWYSEEQLVTTMFPDAGYLRLPTTDHCRPRDSEVDEFVAFDLSVPANTWIHFHCHGGDGRTTIFMAMHDIMHNAPGDSLAVILARQHQIGGENIAVVSAKADSFSYPFDVERVAFVQHFYQYVCAVKPGGFALSWSEWVSGTPVRV